MSPNIKEWIQLARKISKYLLNREEQAENKDIQEWAGKSSANQQILEELNRPDYYVRKAARRQELITKYDWNHFLTSQQQKVKRRRLQIVGYAASILIFIGAGGAVWIYNQSQEIPLLIAVVPEFTPGSTKASLILGDGQEVTLNDQLTLTEKDGTIIQNEESGELAYKAGTSGDTALQYNTLRVPRGGEYRLTLADGTKVWINSESELAFPTRFASDKREVFLKGEAYFEIAHNQSQPFFVHSHNLQVHATGTAFNVIAYQDEPELKVILVEGGVNIENSQSVISQLTPNHEFSMNKENGRFQVTSIDPRSATAWKNGTFFFDDEPLYSIIRKLSRWYNIVIECDKPEINQYKFSGEIRKYEDAIQVLDMLKLTNEITFTILPDKKIVIRSME